MSNRGAAYSGGSGAGFRGIIKIEQTSEMRVIVGEAGVGYSRDINITPPVSSPGASSSFSFANTNLIVAGGGGGASSWQSGGSIGGGGGVSSFNGTYQIDDHQFTMVQKYFENNGYNGSGAAGGSGVAVGGASSVYSGHTYGSSGSAQGDPGGGRSYPSKHGYVLIRYLGQEAPTED